MAPRRILLAVSGGIAAYKIPELVRLLSKSGFDVRCALTPSAAEFVSPLTLQALTGAPVRCTLFDPGEESEIDHIALADWADLVVLAPATANSLAKLALGIADTLVATLLLATRAPVLVAPAMNVNMWEHPSTQENVRRLGERGVRFAGPESGFLACGWEGEGRMAEPETIAREIEAILGSGSLEGEKVLVTAGGTRERIDAVRVLANRSSGKMGFAIAEEAARRGASVTLVAGPVSLPTPEGVRRVDVESAAEMREAVFAELPQISIVVKAAAVADFRPIASVTGKIKKEDMAEGEGLSIALEQTSDILAELCEKKGDRFVVGFAAESEDVVAAAQRKLVRKGCDLIVANDISRADAGFEVDRNAAYLVAPEGEVEELPLQSKKEMAAKIWDCVERMRGS